MLFSTQGSHLSSSVEGKEHCDGITGFFSCLLIEATCSKMYSSLAHWAFEELPCHRETKPLLLSSPPLKRSILACCPCYQYTVIKLVCQSFSPSSHPVPMSFATIYETQCKAIPSSPHSCSVFLFCHHKKAHSTWAPRNLLWTFLYSK